MFQKWKARARTLEQEIHVLTIAYHDPRTPWYGKAFAALVVTDAFSPIDLIPDPIPILGYLDDLVLIPLGVMIAVRMMPSIVMIDARAKVEEAMRVGKPVSWVGAVIIGAFWVLLAGLAIVLLRHLFD
jgi:uncharacterized membrane protein YkvA (DUF1232 family)